ncbi:MAG: hypothetical protein ABSD70_16210 [Terracidiphilus sp.]|jgi:hypothetical protein
MKFPIRFLAVTAAGLSCFASCNLTHAASDGGSPSRAPDSIIIPGPLRSFLRMAGVSQEATSSEVLPLLARNVFLYGHIEQRKTEYLVLADRYVQQARELEPLVGPDGKIHVAGCDDAGRLIQVLGYKFEHGCSPKDASLITADAERAFLTVDSGFPLTQLEQSLQEGTPFSYAFPATRVPILFAESDWQAVLPAKERAGATLLDMLLNDEDIDRLYAGLARLDPQTRSQMLRTVGLRRLLAYAPIFDFYGSRICIRSGAVVVPGGEAAEKNWADLVGADPHAPGDFVYHLLAKDQGWMAAYFDALSRVSPEQQAHLVANGRLKRLYAAYRAPNANLSAGTSVFPRNANLLLLFARVPWDAAGEPEVPGDANVWKDIFAHVDHASHIRELAHFNRDDNSPERMLEALVACTGLVAGEGPAQVYLTLTAINSARPAQQQLSDGTVQLLASHFVELENWYPIFVEFPSLDENSIKGFVDTVDRLNGIGNLVLRANVMGAFQAELGVWQILARQQQIPAEQLNASWKAAIEPYGGIGSPTELFDAARKSLDAILVAAGGKGDFTQGQVVDLLAGPAQSSPEGARVHEEITRRMRAVLDDQRLVPLDTLFGLYDGLGEMAHGAAIGDSLLPLAGALREFELPRPIFTSGERVTWSPTVYVSRHAELQVRTDLTKVIKTPGTPAQLEAARARLAPFLRDTLVGLNYAYYEPPGSQVLHSNPLFVRAHDFTASSIQGIKDVWGPPNLIGIGATAGGGAYFIGSLADLPFALALTEEDFISPEKLQALIWKETVPELLVNSILPRWWTVNQDELHAAALYQRSGEELLTASASHADLREKVLAVFSGRVGSGRMEEMEQALENPDSTASLTAHLLPSDAFYLAAEFRKRFPGEAAQAGPASLELDALVAKDPDATSPHRLATDFGVPHPILADSYSCALITSEPFPVAGGYGSRLFGESWESSNLYWARLADEKGYPPAMLNILVPELTRQMVANISATSIDDWPALLRAMQQTGEEFRQGKINIHTASSPANNQNIANGGTHAE